MQFSILGNGMIGTYLHSVYHDSTLFGRHDNISAYNHNIIVIAGPNGKRIEVEHNPQKDKQDCDILVNQLKKCKYDFIVHLSTIDVVRNDSVYAKNRRYLEKQILKMPYSYAMRIGKGIAPGCTRNIFWDLHNNKWIDKINLISSDQWYPLSLLSNHIINVVRNQSKIDVYSSCPIKNFEIVKTFFPDRVPYLSTKICTNSNITNNNGDYHISKDIIWQEFNRYMFDLQKK